MTNEEMLYKCLQLLDSSQDDMLEFVHLAK